MKHREQLERMLLAQYENQDRKAPIRGRDTSRSSPRRQRTVWTAAIALVLAAAAGAFPVKHVVSVGSLITWELPRPVFETVAIEPVLAHLTTLEVADEISVSIGGAGEGTDLLVVILLGTRESPPEVTSILAERFPELNEATATVEPLAADLQISLARSIGRTLFGITVGSADLEEARARVRLELAQRGLEGAQVQLGTSESGKKIQIELPRKPR